MPVTNPFTDARNLTPSSTELVSGSVRSGVAVAGQTEHGQLKLLVVDMQQFASRSDEMASRYQAAKTRLRKFEEIGPPPEPPRKQEIRMRLRGGRTGVRAVTCTRLELSGLMRPFDLEVFYGERVA